MGARSFGEVRIRAKELRRNLTSAEGILWSRLRNRQLGGLKFRRQHPIGPFIADFYCAEKRLIVEVDGDIHNMQIKQDQARTMQFESYGYNVIRFHNEQVEQELESVLEAIQSACTKG
jgi:very-short-patch-repair endonuclease